MTWDFQDEMGLPRLELAGRETGRGFSHRRWDFQDGNWQVGRREEEFTQEMGHPKWELAGKVTGRGIYHRTWDIQDGNWQLGRREEEFTT